MLAISVCYVSFQFMVRCQEVVRRQVGVISDSRSIPSVCVDKAFVSWRLSVSPLWGTFLWWVFCVPPPLRLLLLCALLSAKLAMLNSQSPPLSSPSPYCSSMQCDSLRGDELLAHGERSKQVHLQYSRAQLLAVTPTRLTSDLVSRLRSL